MIDQHAIPAQYIAVEAKNYSEDVDNPALDQLSSRFSPRRGRIGLLVCRTIDNIPLLLDRCADTFNDDRGLIVPICDDDFIRMLQEKALDLHSRPDEDFLSGRIQNIAFR